MSITWYNKRMKPLKADEFVGEIQCSESESECSPSSDSYHPEEESESDESVESSSQEDNEIGDNEIDNVEDDVHVDEKSSDSPKEDSASKKRKRKPCPLSYCKATVIHIPRHLEEVHGWSKSHAKTALVRFGMRKKYTFSNPDKAPQIKKEIKEEHVKKQKEGNQKVSKDYHYHRRCPLPGCTAMVKRLPPHLRNVHKLNANQVKKALSEARQRVPDSRRVPYHHRRVRDEVDQLLKPEASRETEPLFVISDNENETESSKTVSNESTGESVIGDIHVQEVFQQFKKWMSSADGGKLDAKTSEQHCKQASKLLSIVDEKKQLASLYDSQVINDKFLEGHAKKNYHPKTTQSYLMSLRHFYAFSLTCEFCDGISKEQIVALKEKVSRWSSSFRHSSAKRHWEKMEEDLHSLISPEQINEFERSEASREAICLLGQLSGAHCITLTQAQYTLVRDFLIVEISVDNAIRSGALANMTMGEFKKRKKEGEDNVLLIKDHKTLESHGPARIVLSAKLDSWMTIFVREVRSQVTGVTNDDDSRVFLSWNVQSLASSQISKSMKSVWKKAKIDGDPSSTILRKSAVSKVHNVASSSEEHNDLANLMAHDVATARKYYRLQEKAKSSVKASRKLRTVMREQPQQKISHDLEKESQDIESCSKISAEEECQSTTSKVTWTAEREAVLRTLFQKEINEKEVTMEAVRSNIANHAELKDEDPKRVLDKVRSQWRYAKQSSTEIVSPPSEQETLEQRVQRSLEEDANSDIIPPTVTSSVKNMFSSSDKENIQEVFRDMIEKNAPICKTRIKELLQKESWGRSILKKASLDTVLNRVKYERRLYKNSKNV